MFVADKDKALASKPSAIPTSRRRGRCSTDSLFWIASQSKPITAAALMMLVDEGKVNVDDPVEKYLPEFKGQMVVAEKDDRACPAEEAGASDHGAEHPVAHQRPAVQLADRAADARPAAAGRSRCKSYAMPPLEFEPDTKYQYSNAGINTAGRIIEVVSGMRYEKFLDKRLFGPLGMKDTTFWPTSEQVARLAKSYKPGPGTRGLEETTITQLHYPLTDRASAIPCPPAACSPRPPTWRGSAR